MLKKYCTIALLFQCVSLIATEQQIVCTEQKQETPEVRTYVSPSVETLQADKDFCLKTLSDDASDINALSPSGKTVLQLLTLYFINNFTTEGLIAHALKRGADANVRDELDRTPLFFVTAYALCPEIFAEKQATIDNTLAENQEATADDKDTKATKDEAPASPSQSATANSDSQKESSKVEKDTEVSAPKTTRNPLHDRALSLAVIELLLAFSADSTVTDVDGISPLLLAVSTGDEEVVELFARYGMLEKIFQSSDAKAMEDKENSEAEDSAEETN